MRASPRASHRRAAAPRGRHHGWQRTLGRADAWPRPVSEGHNAGLESVRARSSARPTTWASGGSRSTPFPRELEPAQERGRRPDEACSRSYIEAELPDEVDRNGIQRRARSGAWIGLPPDRAREARPDAECERTRDNGRDAARLRAFLRGVAGDRGRGAQAAARRRDSARSTPSQLDEKTFAAYLYQPDLPDPDLLIRTGGEFRRVSNFLLWQIAYAEIYVSDVMWPEFDKSHLVEAILDYQRRERRYGRTGVRRFSSTPETGAR